MLDLNKLYDAMSIHQLECFFKHCGVDLGISINSRRVRVDKFSDINVLYNSFGICPTRYSSFGYGFYNSISSEITFEYNLDELIFQLVDKTQSTSYMEVEGSGVFVYANSLSIIQYIYKYTGSVPYLIREIDEYDFIVKYVLSYNKYDT